MCSVATPDSLLLRLPPPFLWTRVHGCKCLAKHFCPGLEFPKSQCLLPLFRPTFSVSLYLRRGGIEIFGRRYSGKEMLLELACLIYGGYWLLVSFLSSAVVESQFLSLSYRRGMVNFSYSKYIRASMFLNNKTRMRSWFNFAPLNIHINVSYS